MEGEWTPVKSRHRKKKGKQTNDVVMNGNTQHEPQSQLAQDQTNGHHNEETNGHHHEELNGNSHEQVVAEIPDWGVFHSKRVDELLNVSEKSDKTDVLKMPFEEFKSFLNELRQFKNQKLESNVFLFHDSKSTFINASILSQISSNRIHIQQLHLQNSDVNDQNIKSLIYLKSTLTHLNLHNTPVSDLGIEDLIHYKSLKHLDISNTNVLGSAFIKWRETCFKSYKESKKSLQLIHQQSLPSLLPEIAATTNRKQRREQLKKSLSSSGLQASDSIQFQLESLSLSFTISDGTLVDFLSWSAPKVCSTLKSLSISVSQISRRLLEIISPYTVSSLALIGNWKEVIPLQNLQMLTQVASLRQLSLSCLYLSSEQPDQGTFFRVLEDERLNKTRSKLQKKQNAALKKEENKQQSYADIEEGYLDWIPNTLQSLKLEVGICEIIEEETTGEEEQEKETREVCYLIKEIKGKEDHLARLQHIHSLFLTNTCIQPCNLNSSSSSLTQIHFSNLQSDLNLSSNTKTDADNNNNDNSSVTNAWSQLTHFSICSGKVSEEWIRNWVKLVKENKGMKLKEVHFGRGLLGGNNLNAGELKEWMRKELKEVGVEVREECEKCGEEENEMEGVRVWREGDREEEVDEEEEGEEDGGGVGWESEENAVNESAKRGTERAKERANEMRDYQRLRNKMKKGKDKKTGKSRGKNK